MADLYKGIAGSPITYLTSDISANQTTISIDDDSALPDGPNICTIGYGENLETIKYETKSNGVLQNVTRGIEGTPRAWQAGTEVARFFTAYDHNSIIENFNSHLAENASKHIYESGTNANGSYIKFDDGTAIAHLRKEITASGTVIDFGNIPFPMTFITTPTVDVSKSEPHSQTWAGNIHVGVIGPSTARIIISNVVSGNTYRCNLIVIGRWKL